MGCLPPFLPSFSPTPTLVPPKSLCLFDLSTWKASVINALVAVWLTASTDPPDFPNFRSRKWRRRRRRTKRRRVTENKIDHCGEQYGIEGDLWQFCRPNLCEAPLWSRVFKKIKKKRRSLGFSKELKKLVLSEYLILLIRSHWVGRVCFWSISKWENRSFKAFDKYFLE